MDGKLTQLELRHEAQLETFLSAFDQAPKELHGYFCERDAGIGRAVHSLRSWGLGRELKEGWVPCSTWFWEEAGSLQGVINVRHQLNPQLKRLGGHIGYCVAPAFRRRGVATRMLAATLEQCQSFGIERALLTADANNVGSCKTIEAAGGLLERQAWLEQTKTEQRWYWLELTARGRSPAGSSGDATMCPDPKTPAT